MKIDTAECTAAINHFGGKGDAARFEYVAIGREGYGKFWWLHLRQQAVCRYGVQFEGIIGDNADERAVEPGFKEEGVCLRARTAHHLLPCSPVHTVVRTLNGVTGGRFAVEGQYRFHDSE